MAPPASLVVRSTPQRACTRHLTAYRTSSKCSSSSPYHDSAWCSKKIARKQNNNGERWHSFLKFVYLRVAIASRQLTNTRPAKSNLHEYASKTSSAQTSPPSSTRSSNCTASFYLRVRNFSKHHPRPLHPLPYHSTPPSKRL